MKIKLIVMDMDGTLLDDSHVTIPQRNIDALQQASGFGVRLAIASGRTWSIMQDAVRQLGHLDYALLSNGAVIRDVAAGRQLGAWLIPNAEAVQLIDLLHEEEVPFEVYCEGQNYARKKDQDFIRRYNVSPAFSAVFDQWTQFSDNLAEALHGRDVEKINVFYVPPEKREKISQEAQKIGSFASANAFAENMEFAAGGVSKGHALQVLAQQLGLSARDVMVFGDAGNDLEMLQWAKKWSFAMANGSPEAKKAARFQAPSNEEAGIAQIVEQYLQEEKEVGSLRKRGSMKWGMGWGKKSRERD